MTRFTCACSRVHSHGVLCWLIWLITHDMEARIYISISFFFSRLLSFILDVTVKGITTREWEKWDPAYVCPKKKKKNNIDLLSDRWTRWLIHPHLKQILCTAWKTFPRRRAIITHAVSPVVFPRRIYPLPCITFSSLLLFPSHLRQQVNISTRSKVRRRNHYHRFFISDYVYVLFSSSHLSPW